MCLHTGRITHREVSYAEAHLGVLLHQDPPENVGHGADARASGHNPAPLWSRAHVRKAAACSFFFLLFGLLSSAVDDDTRFRDSGVDGDGLGCGCPRIGALRPVAAWGWCCCCRRRWSVSLKGCCGLVGCMYCFSVL